jgi:hypothetical protein
MNHIPYQFRLVFSALFWGLVLSVMPLGELFAATESEQIEEIRGHYATLQKAQSDFVLLRDQNRLGRAERDDFSAWIQQLNEQILQDCNTLLQAGDISLPDDLPCANILSNGVAPATIDISSEHTEAERTNSMIEQFNSTLGEFDERMLQEQDRVKAQRPLSESSEGVSGGGQASSESEGDLARDSAAAENDRQGKQGETQAAQNQNNETGSDQATASQKGSRGKAKPGAASEVPDNIPDGSDDDVVARQLREAAEKESDPELKRKLWEEYRRYKDGIS